MSAVSKTERCKRDTIGSEGTTQNWYNIKVMSKVCNVQNSL